MNRSLAALLTVGLFGGCGGEDPVETQPIDYYEGTASAALGHDANQAKCATCHSNDGSLRSGTTLKDIAYRASFKGGDAPNLLAGVNACVTGWMGGTALSAEDPAYGQLLSYLRSISASSVTTPNPIAPEVLADEAAYELAYAGGNVADGAAKYSAKCAVCHDAGLNVGGQAAIAKATLKSRTVGRIAQKVRTSGPPPSGTADASDSTPGPMPFFEPSDLSSQDLKDIIAYLRGV